MASNSPIVLAAANRGEVWAVKLKQSGWKTLSKAQKAAARAQGIGAAPLSQTVPKTTRIIQGNPTFSRRSRDAPGNAQKSMTIVKSEFLGEVSADGAIHTYTLDPRNVRTFPHISDLARGFNKYKFGDLKVRYSAKVQESGCGVCIAFTPDSSDPKPKGKFDLYSLGSRAEGAAHRNLLYTVPIDKSQRFLRDCATENSKDVDAGSLFVLVDGQHDGRVGELFLEVTIVLSQPTYNQRATQLLAGTTHRDGPTFVKAVKSANTVSLTFQAAGNYLVSTYSSLLERVGRLALGEAEQSQVDSSTHSSNVVEALVAAPGGSIVYYFKTPDQMSFRAYVCRM
ncbi:coat protein [Pelargonium ringspot virus]|uniref:Capsid protein n=1 Tax=Pelargonium ringspot virus TaxID=167020 RepID=Q911J5_9TOMB|nr:coat protein [Pelargonium ringspot virus]AAK74063.1 coat protein [Pelargonium ringspot virus]